MPKTFIDICTSSQNPQLNTGFRDNCIESKLLIPVLSNGFEFASVADFKTVASWRTAIAAKSLVPLFPVYELADASTEDTLFESGNFSRVTSKGTEIITFECYLSIAAYAALKSYGELGNYTEMFEYNEEGDYFGVFAADGTKVKGRKITGMEVTRIRATNDKVPFVTGRITFADKNDVLSAVLVKSDLTNDHLEGIYDLSPEIVTASATEITFKLKNGNQNITSLVSADVQLVEADGTTPVTASFVTADANGIYTLTGTAFATGMILTGTGVITQSTILYEVQPQAITIPTP